MTAKNLFVIGLLTAVIAAGTAHSAESPGTLAAGEGAVKQLLGLMDTDRNGKVSKQEFLDFMSAEFDRLDVNKDGELDPKELAALRVRPLHGYGK